MKLSELLQRKDLDFATFMGIKNDTNGFWRSRHRS